MFGKIRIPKPTPQLAIRVGTAVAMEGLGLAINKAAVVAIPGVWQGWAVATVLFLGGMRTPLVLRTVAQFMPTALEAK